MGAIGQQHRLMSKTDLEALFDEIVDMRDIDGVTGRVIGRKGLLTVDFNLTGGSTFSVNYTDPDLGSHGIRSPDNNIANSFQALTNWFYDNLGGTVLRYTHLESGAQNGNLQFDFGSAAGNPQVDTSDQCSLLFGYHHTVPALGTKPATSVDTLPRLGTRRKADLTTFGLNPYDGSNQTIGKYNWFVGNILRVLGETISSYVWGAPAWENTDGSAPYQLDAPVPQHVPDNISYPYKQDQLQLHIGVFTPPVTYNSLSPDATKFLTATSASYVSGGGVQPIGHMDGSYAVLPYAGVRHGDSTHKIQSVPYQYQLKGIRCRWMLRKSPLSDFTTAEQVQVNFYKSWSS
jgi:hypothetical protein